VGVCAAWCGAKKQNMTNEKERQDRCKELEKTLTLFLDFLDSLPAGWLGKTTGDIGLLNEAYISARKLGLMRKSVTKGTK